MVGATLAVNTLHLRTSHRKPRGERIKQVDKIEKLLLRIPHSAGGLTEKRISSKVRKNAEGPKSVTGSGVSNGKTGSFGDRSRSMPRSRNSRMAE
jgi:hypothetical protein